MSTPPRLLIPSLSRSTTVPQKLQEPERFGLHDVVETSRASRFFQGAPPQSEAHVDVADDGIQVTTAVQDTTDPGAGVSAGVRVFAERSMGMNEYNAVMGAAYSDVLGSLSLCRFGLGIPELSLVFSLQAHANCIFPLVVS